MHLEILSETFYQEYECFLSNFEESLLYYSVKYKLLLEELLNVKSHYLIARDNDKIQAILPLMKKEGPYGTIINSLPYYGSNGGVLSLDKRYHDFLLQEYTKLIQLVAGATYINNPLNFTSLPLDYDILDQRIGQWTPIEYNNNIEEQIMSSYHGKTRNLVRKAIKLNIKVNIDNSQIDFLYSTHHENITSIGGKAKEQKFFNLLETYFEAGKDYNIYIATFEGKRIGALLLFYYNKTVEYFTPAVLTEYRNYQPTSLLIYQAMIDASKQKYSWWNWGGTWLTQDGVYHFKKRFGAIDKKYNYYIKVNNKEIYYATKKELLSQYNNFYVLPFNQLKEKI
jgi:hypothetical protein